MDGSMVGIVIVSHSHMLAQGVRELAQQVSQGKVAIATAGGLDERTLGTNPERILEAIREAWSPGGVLVLMDLGSAVLSAEVALESLPETERAQVMLCEAPLVEGAVAAAAVIAAGATLKEACEEARGSLRPKQQQLGAEPGVDEPKPEPTAQRQATRSEPDLVHASRVRVPNPLGLHARPAAQFVQTASRFDARVRVRNLTRQTGFVNGRSVNAVALLDAAQGDELEIEAEGPQAIQAVEALVALLASGFGEGGGLPETSTQAEGPKLAEGQARQLLRGIPASPGVALAPVVHLRPARPVVGQTLAEGSAEQQLRRLHEAVHAVSRDIQELIGAVRSDIDEHSAAIFEVHRAMLTDPDTLEDVRRAIVEEGLTAEAAWDRQLTQVASRYRHASNPVLQARAVDVEDVRDRVLRALVGAGPVVAPRLSQPSVLVARELTPSLAVELDRDNVRAICTALGGATSHAALLVRSFNIPTVVGLGEEILRVAEGTVVGVDSRQGVVAVEPDETARAYFAREYDRWVAQRKQAEVERRLPALTRDGHRVEVAANVGSLEDAKAAQRMGAEGIGLLRTEFLFLGRRESPTEEEQTGAYRAIVEAVAPNPVVIRTLDVGGDKRPDYLNLGQEANPFLGLRGLRVSLAYPEVFRTQLRAILRAATAGPVRIMFPMVATVQELEAAIAQLRLARDELHQAGLKEAAEVPLQVGIMVEVPSSALLVDKLVDLVEFFSIGTNDLTQYTMAAERGNARVAGLLDHLHPSVLRLIGQVVETARQAGRRTAVCGEMAADILAVPVLVGLGIDELSMAPASVPTIKRLVRQLDKASCREVAQEALQARSTQAVRALVHRRLGSLVGGF